MCGPGQPYGIVIEFAAPTLLRYTPGPSTEMSTLVADRVVQLSVTCCGLAGTDDDASGFGTVQFGVPDIARKLVICTAGDAVDVHLPPGDIARLDALTVVGDRSFDPDWIYRTTPPRVSR